MGNHAKRKQLAKQYKACGLPRLYRGNKFAAYRMLKHSIDSLLLKTEFPPGSLVNDCDGWNHRIARWFCEEIPYWRCNSPRTKVTFIDQFVDTNERWSCGCPSSPDPAKTNEEILSFKISFAEDEYCKQWLSEESIKLYNDMKNGIPVVDENGIPFIHRKENEQIP